jgi:hypothetical protein
LLKIECTYRFWSVQLLTRWQRSLITHLMTLSYTTAVAAHARGHEDLAHLGSVSGTSVFLSAPWTTLSRGESNLRWDFEPAVLSRVENRLHERVESSRLTINPFGRAVARAAYDFGILNPLVGTMGEEVTEFIYADDGKVIARATVPLGTRALVRTLRTHGGLTQAEAHSALSLTHELGGAHPYIEPLRATAKHYAGEFSNAVHELTRGIASTLLIIAPHPVDDFVARALSSHAHPPFPEGSSVRALSARHLEPLISSHSKTRDIPLMLGALYTRSLLPVVQ